MTYTADNMERMLGNLATNADAERFASYLIARGWELEEDSEGQVVAFKGGEEMTEQEWQDELAGCFRSPDEKSYATAAEAINDDGFVQDFVDGFYDGAPAGYSTDEDCKASSPWCTPWHWCQKEGDWFNPSLSPYEMGKAFAAKVYDDLEEVLEEDEKLRELEKKD